MGPAAATIVAPASGFEVDGEGCGDRCAPAGAWVVVTVTVGLGRACATGRDRPGAVMATANIAKPAANTAGPPYVALVLSAVVFINGPSLA